MKISVSIRGMLIGWEFFAGGGMRGNLRCIALVMLLAAFSFVCQGEESATVVHVLDKTEIGGIAGIVLLVNPGDLHKSQAFITDPNGFAYMPHKDCGMCVIAAFDPRGIFFNRTTEFDSRNLSVKLVLELRPI